jgi:hypothetical protein
MLVIGWVLLPLRESASRGGTAARRRAPGGQRQVGGCDAPGQAAGRRRPACHAHRMVVLQRPSADCHSGERYSFHMASFLRQGTLTHTVFHGSLLDHQNEKLYTEQARTAGNPSHGRRDGFDFSFGDWQMRGEGAQHAAKMAGKDFALELQLVDKNPPVLHQAPGTPVAGLLDFGAAGMSYYTSRPRMSAEGTLTLDGKPVPVHWRRVVRSSVGRLRGGAAALELVCPATDRRRRHHALRTLRSPGKTGAAHGHPCQGRGRHCARRAGFHDGSQRYLEECLLRAWSIRWTGRSRCRSRA